jgi:hypothetical protein
MDIEQLKIIVDTANSMGLETKNAFMWWLALEKGSTLLISLVWTGIALWLIKLVYALLRNHLASERLRKAARVSMCFNESELARAEAVLRKYYQ